jgi:serine/threonine protein kinase
MPVTRRPGFFLSHLSSLVTTISQSQHYHCCWYVHIIPCSNEFQLILENVVFSFLLAFSEFLGAVINSREEPMLVMEYMSHGSLYDILHNETMVLEGPMLLEMLCDICQGVRFLHACDPEVIHCDLKASNILVDSKFRAKVRDKDSFLCDNLSVSSSPPQKVADFGLSTRQRAGAIGKC